MATTGDTPHRAEIKVIAHKAVVVLHHHGDVDLHPAEMSSHATTSETVMPIAIAAICLVTAADRVRQHQLTSCWSSFNPTLLS